MIFELPDSGPDLYGQLLVIRRLGVILSHPMIVLLVLVALAELDHLGLPLLLLTGHLLLVSQIVESRLDGVFPELAGISFDGHVVGRPEL